MELEAITDEEILKVWQMCTTTYLQYGIKIKFPENTDKKKTYQWRYVKAITKKFKDWEFDNDTAQQFIDIAVSYARQRKIHQKGLAALHQSDLLDRCYKVLTNKNKQRLSIAASLQDMKKWFDSQVGDNVKIDTLLYRKNKRSFPNIILWKQSNKISDLFISLSKSCCRAVNRLQNDEIDRRMLPSTTDLYLIRIDFLSEQNNVTFARKLFGSDWRSK